MQCPKCEYDHESQTTECLKCGIVFAKYFRLREIEEKVPDPIPVETETADTTEDRRELKYRVLAIPVALVAAKILVSSAPFLVRLITMLVHESGHAVTAWLCGFSAVPGLWFTSVSPDRVPLVSLTLVASVGFGGFQFWRMRRWMWVAAGAAVFLIQVRCTLLPLHQAHALVTFGGDAGSLVLGTLLMMTFYASRENVLYRNSLRWGLLAIGAASFIDVFSSWTAGTSAIVFGEQDGFPTDPSVLVDVHRWGIPLMIGSYVRLGVFCLMGLAAAYIAGIVSIRKRLVHP